MRSWRFVKIKVHIFCKKKKYSQFWLTFGPIPILPGTPTSENTAAFPGGLMWYELQEDNGEWPCTDIAGGNSCCALCSRLFVRLASDNRLSTFTPHRVALPQVGIRGWIVTMDRWHTLTLQYPAGFWESESVILQMPSNFAVFSEVAYERKWHDRNVGWAIPASFMGEHIMSDLTIKHREL